MKYVLLFPLFLATQLLLTDAADDNKCNLWQGICPPGWKKFIRNNRDGKVSVCLRIFNQNATYLEAQQICRKQYNSRISGVSTTDEHQWLKMKMKKVITNEKGNMWVGARRKWYCYDKQPVLQNKPGCTIKNEQFDWDDQLTDNKYLFTQWDQTVGAPNGEISNGAAEDCVVMNVHENIGYIDDKDCTIPQQGFLCGLSA